MDLVATSNGIWAATDSGVGRFDGTSWIPAASGLPSLEVRTIAALDTAVWVGTDNGIATWRDARWVVENEGVQPDIVVDLNSLEMAKGYDAQLMEGIKYLMKKIKEEPKSWPNHPPFPVDK